MRAGLLVVGQQHQQAALGPEVAEQLDRLLGGGLARTPRRPPPRSSAVPGMLAERRPQRAPARLAVHLHGVGARRGTEGDPAAGPMRRADRPGAGTAGALLAPWLGATTRHLAARARRGGAATARELLRAHGLVDDGLMERLVEDRVRQVELALRAEPRGGGLTHCAPPRVAPSGPGIGAAHDQQVALGVHVDDLEAALRDALVAHLPRHPLALHDSRGRGAGADRSGRAHVVGAVARPARGRSCGAGSCPGSPCPSSGPDTFTSCAGLEALDRHLLADLHLALVVVAAGGTRPARAAAGRRPSSGGRRRPPVRRDSRTSLKASCTAR